MKESEGKERSDDCSRTEGRPEEATEISAYRSNTSENRDNYLSLTGNSLEV